MSVQVESSCGEPLARPQHLNLAAPLTPRTLETIHCEISKDMISVIAMQARSVISCTPVPALASSTASAAGAGSRQPRSDERLPSPPTTPSSGLTSVPPLDMFITNLVLRSRVQAGTLICTLVYLRRLRARLPKEARGMECTCHRIFLATLIVAGKYLNDASPKNKYWARYSTVFTVAEVNLMEKQLLFLLDFDLRIDNSDLNEASSVFAGSELNADVPLTPTTPPTTAAQAEAVQPIGDDAHVPRQKAVDSYTGYTPHKMYPPTLGLGGAPESLNSQTRRPDQPKRQASSSIPYLVSDPVTPGSTSRHASRQPSGMSSVSKTPASLLRQMPVDDKATLHPSPKKRAVSRGHHSNVPHPSPVYHHSMQSAATTVQVPSATTVGSACFLQPPEDPSKYSSTKHASSRYQQQRYDPQAAPATRAMPRASMSIPSMRTTDMLPSMSIPSLHMESPLAHTRHNADYNVGSSSGSNRPHKARHILRHQSTLPDMGRMNSAQLSDPAYAPTLRHEASALPQSLSALMNAHSGALPTLPPPARLASGSYRSDYSPGNTLVYEPSPAVSVAHHGRARTSSRQPSESRHALDTLPVSALSALSVDARSLQAAADQLRNIVDYDADQTLSYAHADARSRHAPAHDSGSSSGWQLKSKFLHPLSSWFRSSRHQSSANSSSPNLASAPKYVLAGSHKPCDM
ncbi:PHO85 cyclin-1 [Coemansia sp. RSA 1807]|nr:PHO85 cyclin-1 [Coemansia sp. RSA 454]KAJ2575057.1 PHO85 cyclin-1 [Coemansia sp. RSA 1807]